MKMHLKKKKKSNFLYYIIITILIYLFIDKNFKNIEFKNSNEDFVNQVLQGSNYHLVTSKNDITNDLFYAISNVEIKNPVLVLDKVFSYKEDVEQIYIQEFSYVQNSVVDTPRVYIYSTHPSEKYNDNKSSVVMASLDLQDKLNSLGIETIVEERNVDEYKKVNYIANDKYGYKASRIFINDALKKYGSFDLIIDLHRDSVAENVSTTTEINGKKYAKVMFVMNKELTNYNFADNINNTLTKKYPTISRGLYSKRADYFNQDLNNKVILLELGSTHNSYDEVKNTIEVFANTIKEILNEE